MTRRRISGNSGSGETGRSGELHWGDETWIRGNPLNGRGYAPKGKTPVIRPCAKRTAINMISMVTNQEKDRFMFCRDSMNAKRPIKFLKQLIKSTDKEVFLALDNLLVHHSKPEKECLAEHAE